MTPPIYSLPVGKERLLVSPLQQISALLNQEALKIVTRGLKAEGWEDLNNNDLDAIAALLRETPADPPETCTGGLEPAFLGLIPTRSCNMSCGYCDFGSDRASEKQMPLSMAVDAVDWMAKTVQASGGSHLEIHFFGGEPLVALEVVEAAVHRARMKADELDLDLHLEVSTNGYMDDLTARFVGDHFDAVVVSIDGFEQDHDRNRPKNQRKGSFKRVIKTIEQLADSSTQLCLRCCVTDQSVQKMNEITHWFCDAFQPSVINFETVSANPKSEANQLLPPDPYEFVRNCILSVRIAQGYGIPLVYASAAAGSPRTTFCPVGRDTLIVTPDGRVNECYLMEDDWVSRGMDMAVGEYSSQKELLIDMKAVRRLRDMVKHKPGCGQCFCRWSCAGGCHVKHDVSIFPMQYDDFCIQTRLLTAGLALDEMGLEAVTDDLMDCREKMTSLALNPADLLT